MQERQDRLLKEELEQKKQNKTNKTNNERLGGPVRCVIRFVKRKAPFTSQPNADVFVNVFSQLMIKYDEVMFFCSLSHIMVSCFFPIIPVSSENY